LGYYFYKRFSHCFTKIPAIRRQTMSHHLF
jgi:hypothetical protein